MTTHTFPWQQVAQSCPQAFEAFYNEMYDAFPLPETLDEFYFALVKHAALVSEVGYLEAFFDGQGILVACIPKTRKGSFISTISTPAFVYRFGEGVWDLGFRISASGCEHIFPTRQEAQIAGFVRAFELLEERLTNRPENPDSSN